jgi:putative peptidoglycan lipid II flippase
VLAGPLIGLMFERGQFTATDTQVTAQVLRLYLLGIPFAAVDLLLIFAFYAKKDSLTPALVGVFSLGCYIVIALLLNPYIGFYGLMIADSLKHLIHMLVSLLLLNRRLKGFGAQNLFITVSKISMATLVMGLITFLLLRSVPELLPINDIRQRLILVAVPAMLGGATYLILASLLKLNELQLFIQALRRKIVR